MSKQAIEFYFDFSSPFAYIGSEVIEAVAERQGVEIKWRPFLIGAAFKAVGSKPLLHAPLKGDYSKRDMERTARKHGIPFVLPDVMSLKTVPASRAVYWAEGNAPDKLPALVHAVYRHAFAEDKDYSDAETVADLAAGVGIDKSAVLAGMQDQAIKDRLRDEVERGLERGVFGTPMFFYGDEPFWGVDHIPDLERWIETGGW